MDFRGDDFKTIHKSNMYLLLWIWNTSIQVEL